MGINKYDYDEEKEIFTIKHNTKFKTHIDVRLRIRYYLLSYLRRAEREGKTPHFEDIIFNILPLLKNGITLENQTILNVLEDLAERVSGDCWRLKSDGVNTLFDM